MTQFGLQLEIDHGLNGFVCQVDLVQAKGIAAFEVCLRPSTFDQSAPSSSFDVGKWQVCVDKIDCDIHVKSLLSARLGWPQLDRVVGLQGELVPLLAEAHLATLFGRQRRDRGSQLEVGWKDYYNN